MTEAARRLRYWPALDGLRGLSVVAVLAFHGQLPWASGGYLGVSAFFTLSGFLITSLLIAELASTGRVDLKAFWARRCRRLLPAGLAGLALILVTTAVAPELGIPGLRGDVFAAVTDVANWRFVVDGTSYADLFRSSSPVQHYWSLAIEEQFYLLFPLGCAVAAIVAKRRWRTALAVGAATLLTLSVVLSVLLHDPGSDPARVYYGTDTRAAELLVGVLLAIAVARRGNHARSVLLPAPVPLIALGVLLVAWATVPQSAPWLHGGGLLGHAVVTALVVAGCTTAGGVARVPGTAPLQALGRVSYGVYVYHWPVFLWLSPDRTGLPTAPLFGLRVAVTLALAQASFVFLERPIRAGARLTAWRPFVVAPGAAVAVSIAVLALPLTPPHDIDFDAAQQALISSADRATVEPEPVIAQLTDPTIPAPPEIVVVPVGDSTAVMTMLGVARRAHETGALRLVDGMLRLGCSVGRGGERQADRMEPVPDEECDWEALLPPVLDAPSGANVAVVQYGPWDITGRLLPGDDMLRHPGDPVYDEFLLGEMAALTDLLRSHDLLVVWLTAPRVGNPWTDPSANHPERTDRYNELVRSLARLRPGVRIVDLAAYVHSLPGGEDDRVLRPDAVHFSQESSYEVSAWILPALVTAVQAADGAVIGPTTPLLAPA